MKRFLAVYLGTMNGEEMARFRALDKAAKKEKKKAGMEAWMKWMQDHQASIVEQALLWEKPSVLIKMVLLTFAMKCQAGSS